MCPAYKTVLHARTRHARTAHVTHPPPTTPTRQPRRNDPLPPPSGTEGLGWVIQDLFPFSRKKNHSRCPLAPSIPVRPSLLSRTRTLQYLYIYFHVRVYVCALSPSHSLYLRSFLPITLSLCFPPSISVSLAPSRLSGVFPFSARRRCCCSAPTPVIDTFRTRPDTKVQWCLQACAKRLPRIYTKIKDDGEFLSGVRKELWLRNLHHRVSSRTVPLSTVGRKCDSTFQAQRCCQRC